MTFQNLITRNNITWLLDAGISTEGETLIIKEEYQDLFPEPTAERKYLVTVERIDEEFRVTKREIMKVIDKIANVLTVERSAWYCPSSYDATEYTNTAFSFLAGDRVSLYITAENDEDIKTELERMLWSINEIFESLSDEDVETTYNVAWQLEQVVDNKNSITVNLTRTTTPTYKIEIQVVWDPKKYTVLYDANGVLESIKYL